MSETERIEDLVQFASSFLTLTRVFKQQPAVVLDSRLSVSGNHVLRYRELKSGRYVLYPTAVHLLHKQLDSLTERRASPDWDIYYDAALSLQEIWEVDTRIVGEYARIESARFCQERTTSQIDLSVIFMYSVGHRGNISIRTGGKFISSMGARTPQQLAGKIMMAYLHEGSLVAISPL